MEREGLTARLAYKIFPLVPGSIGKAYLLLGFCLLRKVNQRLDRSFSREKILLIKTFLSLHYSIKQTVAS
jgi:hypothetical protein